MTSVSFKMLGRDVDSSPVEYRTWVVDGYPDYDGYYYTGPKGGTNPLADVLAFELPGDIGPVDFNLPDPTTWQTTYTQLPSDLRDAHLAVIDGYIYLFGGKISDKIYRASTGRPTDWVDTGAVLPTPLYGAQVAIILDRVYLFGGNNGVATDTVYSAPTSDPLTWTNHGSVLPQHLYHSQLLITGSDGYIYLFGGRTINALTDHVIYASVYDPFMWTTHSRRLPTTLCGSSVTFIADVVYLLGGMVGNTHGVLPTSDVYYIELAELIIESNDWTVLADELPYAMAYAQFLTVGRSGYLIGIDHERTGYYYSEGSPPAINYAESGTETYNTKIFKCNLSPDSYYSLGWIKLTQEITGEIFQSQAAIIYDRLFLFGGNGNSIIFACKPIIKYDLPSAAAFQYGDVTRTQYSAAIDPLELFRILCFPSWKTDYFNDAPLHFLFATFSSTKLVQESSLNIDSGEGYRIDWGDLNIEEDLGTGSLEIITHNYSVAGTYNQKWLAKDSTDSVVEFICKDNSLTGNILFPKYLSFMTGFDCSDNSLTGNINSLTTNTSLVSFNCGNNQFSNTIPSLESNLNLQYFLTHNNQFSGSIPSLSLNTSLIGFRCDDNLLTGTIPSLDLNSNLEYFYCNGNQLTGSIPSLTNNISLAEFKAEENQLSSYVASTIPLSCIYFSANDNLLTKVSINQILSDFVTNLSFRQTVGSLILNGTGNSSPDMFGKLNKLTIIDHGWTVLTNVSEYAFNITTDNADGLFHTLRFNVNIGATFYVDWGDGSIAAYYGEGTNYSSPQTITHTYSSVSTYVITIGLESENDLTYFAYTNNSAISTMLTLGVFPSLYALESTTNRQTGSIPALSFNTLLETFICDYNLLSGTVPALTNNLLLKTFSCANNQITGSIPSLANNTALESFGCNSNLLSGIIPSLAANTSLQYFNCADNQISGYTTSVLSNTLIEFYANDNLLTESDIDQVLADFVTGYMSRPITGTIDLSGNVPPSITGLLDKYVLEDYGWTVNVDSSATSFQYTTVQQDIEFDFTIFAGIHYSINWGDFLLSDTYVGTSSSQTINHTYAFPASHIITIIVDHPLAVIAIDGYSNQLSGTISSLALVTALEDFAVSNNLLTSTIPSVTTNTVLQRFVCDRNLLTGSIPSLTANILLEEFVCYDNNLSGSMPAFTTNAILVTFDCNTNGLTGTISSIDNNPLLEYFDCSDNSLSAFLLSFSNNIALKHFDSSNNLLTGSIPSLNNNTALEYFNCAQDSGLTGSIPVLTNNIALVYFNCAYNQISGSIPSLNTNTVLSIFDCSNNSLTGTIPSLDNNVALTFFDCGNNNLTGSTPSLSNNILLEEFYCNINSLDGQIGSLTGANSLTIFNCRNNSLIGCDPSVMPLSLWYYNAYYNRLTKSSVDQVLSDFVTNLSSRPLYGYINLADGNNIAPSSVGKANKALIEARGWTVLVSPTVPVLWATFYNYTFSWNTEVDFTITSAAGTEYKINWGDGTIVYYVGDGTDLTSSHTYGSIINRTLYYYVDDITGVYIFDCRSSYQSLYANAVPNISLATNLTAFYSHNTKFNGGGSASLPSLPASLLDIGCSNSGLSGNLPASATLQILDGYSNSFEAEATFNMLPSIVRLNLRSNNMTSYNYKYTWDGTYTGAIPLLSSNPNLEYLDLSWNAFNGNLPPNYFDSCLFLKHINLAYNGFINISTPFPLGHWYSAPDANFPSVDNCTGLEYLNYSYNTKWGGSPSYAVFYGFDSMPSLTNNTALKYFNCSWNSATFYGSTRIVERTMTSLSTNVALEYFNCTGCGIDGTISSLTNNVLLRTFICSLNTFTTYTGSTIALSCTEFDASRCNLNQASVDAILADFATDISLRPTYGFIDLSSILSVLHPLHKNAAPSDSGLLSKAIIQSHGWCVLTTGDEPLSVDIGDNIIAYVPFEWNMVANYHRTEFRPLAISGSNLYNSEGTIGTQIRRYANFINSSSRVSSTYNMQYNSPKEISVSFWGWTDLDPLLNNGEIFTKTDTYGAVPVTRVMTIYVSGGNLIYGIYTNAGYLSGSVSASVIPPSSWHNYVLTFKKEASDAIASLYIDGVFVSDVNSGVSTNINYLSNGEYCWGSHATVSNSILTRVANIYLYEKPMTVAEVYARYNKYLQEE